MTWDLELIVEVKSENILDVWILAKLAELNNLAVSNLDNYKVLEPTRAMREFIGDLSTWYLRRSRERIKEGEVEAKKTLYFVLKNFVKIMAPFAPFSAEDIWLKLRNETDAESVHLASWPELKKLENKEVLDSMQSVRDYVAVGHMGRQKLKFPVRQPLASFFVPIIPFQDYIEILKDELNVKEIKTSVKQGEIDIYFDETITPELKQEGDYRELVRGIQDMRKAMGLVPSDVVQLLVFTNVAGEELINKFKTELLKVVGASSVEFADNDGTEIKVDELVFKVKLNK